MPRTGQVIIFLTQDIFRVIVVCSSRKMSREINGVCHRHHFDRGRYSLIPPPSASQSHSLTQHIGSTKTSVISPVITC
ncbi:hypothetical protein A4A49_10700 [Nicotiana attenuata]|uniref:Uncharacterized protein n=1 Tax=Nicotiana attenuata TaxID=49451 RepID=A0A1J6IPX1_NICAT|nr:hypothetical protein A4A49_10700 [Nicotiana attenuata]